MTKDFGLCNKCSNRIKDKDADWVCELIQGIDEITGEKIKLHSKPYHVQQCGARRVK